MTSQWAIESDLGETRSLQTLARWHYWLLKPCNPRTCNSRMTHVQALYISDDVWFVWYAPPTTSRTSIHKAVSTRIMACTGLAPHGRCAAEEVCFQKRNTKIANQHASDDLRKSVYLISMWGSHVVLHQRMGRRLHLAFSPWAMPTTKSSRLSCLVCSHNPRGQQHAPFCQWWASAHVPTQ